MNLNQKMCKAEEEKQAGNKFFKGGNFKKATKKYHFALMYLKDVENPSPLEKMSGGGDGKPKVSEKELIIIKNLRSICYNNLAACLSKTGNFDKVIEYTTKTLDIEPKNVKALFRRGEALIKQEDFEKAEKDLLEVKRLDKTTTCVEKYFPIIEAAKKRQMSLEKEMYKKMMSGSKVQVT